MAPAQTILRFPQNRKKSAFVLVQAVSTGRHPLDLRLVGTDGFSPFVTTCKWLPLRATPDIRPPLIYFLGSGILRRPRSCKQIAHVSDSKVSL